MRRSVLAFALGLMMVMALPASAANLHFDHVGASCAPGQEGTWHFVNNQTGGASAGTLQASFDGGDTTFVELAHKVNRGTQHWTVTGGTTLDSASTNLPGKLVLSDFSCRDVKKDCDPKDKCEPEK